MLSVFLWRYEITSALNAVCMNKMTSLLSDFKKRIVRIRKNFTKYVAKLFSVSLYTVITNMLTILTNLPYLFGTFWVTFY